MFLSKILSAAEHPYLFGKGGRMKNNGTPQVILKSHNINIILHTFIFCQGLTIPTIKHHVALQPLFVIMGAGIIFVALYVGRSVTESRRHL